MFHKDVAKLDRDVAQVAMGYTRMFQVYYWATPPAFAPLAGERERCLAIGSFYVPLRVKRSVRWFQVLFAPGVSRADGTRFSPRWVKS